MLGDTSRVYISVQSTHMPDDTFHTFFFPFLRQWCADETAHINPAYAPLFLLNRSFLSAVTEELIYCASHLIHWLPFHFKGTHQNQDYTQRWQWYVFTYQIVQEGSLWRRSATQSLIQMTQFSFALINRDGTLHSQTKFPLWLMEPSAVRLRVEPSFPGIYLEADLSCPNWHILWHESPKINLCAEQYVEGLIHSNLDDLHAN